MEDPFEDLVAQIRAEMPGLPEFMIHQAVFASWIKMRLAELSKKPMLTKEGKPVHPIGIISMYAASLRMALATAMQLFAPPVMEGRDPRLRQFLEILNAIDVLEGEVGFRPAGAPPILQEEAKPKLFVPSFDPTDH